MIKQAVSGNDVYIKMSTGEFEGLARKQVGDIADGAQVSLLWLKTLIQTSSGDASLLQTVQDKCDTLSESIGELLA